MAFLVYAACFLSGAAALAFETLWFRLAGLTFGNSVWASSLVLGSFMTGVGFGSYLAARSGRKFRRPLLVYAILELIIGITGTALVFGFPHFTPLLLPLFRTLVESSTLMNVARLTVAFLLFVIPATAMGATLPVLVQALSSRDRNFGALLGKLYGINTLGATVGTILAGAVLIPKFGLRATGIIAGGWDIAAASLILAALIRIPEVSAADREPAATPAEKGWFDRILLTAMLCGGALLALEVVWMRYLSLFLPETTLTFCIVLAVVLAGIAAGGFIASVLARRLWKTYIPHLALGAAILVVLGYVLTGNSAPDQRAPPSKIVELALQLCFLVSLVSGMLFAACGQVVKERFQSEIKGTGLLTLANTIGAAVGSIGAGFVLIPLAGMEFSFFSIATLYILISLLALDRDCLRPGSGRRSIAYFCIAGVALAAIVLYPFGYMRNYVIPTIARQFFKGDSRLVAIREGNTETAIYLRSDLAGVPVSYRLLTNGHSMSGTGLQALRYMRLYVYLPLALDPEATDALLICFGVGTTASALTDSSRLRTIDVVDISENVLNISKEVNFYGDRHPLNDPRVRAIVEDGRFFLQSTKKKYDLITAEPPPPRLTGVCNIYSREYFHLLRDRLKEGGIATYWLPLYELHKSEAQAITSAFREVFPDATLWAGAGSDLMLLGTNNRKGGVTEEQFSALWKETLTRRKLEETGLDRPEDLGALFVADTKDIDAWINKVPPLQDNYPGVMQWFGREFPDDLQFLSPMYAERFAGSSFIREHWPEELRKRTLEQFRYQGYLNDYFEGNRRNHLIGLVQILTETERPDAALVLIGVEPTFLKLIDQAEKDHAGDGRLLTIRAAQALAGRKYAEAAGLFRTLSETDRSSQMMGLLVISTLLSGDATAARQILEDAQRAPVQVEENILTQLTAILERYPNAVRGDNWE